MQWIESGFILEHYSNTKLCWCDWHDCLFVDVKTPYAWRYIADHGIFSLLSAKRATDLHNRWLRLQGD